MAGKKAHMQAERSVVQTVQRKAASWDAMLVGPTAQTTAVDWAERSAVQTATTWAASKADTWVAQKAAAKAPY